MGTKDRLDELKRALPDDVDRYIVEHNLNRPAAEYLAEDPKRQQVYSILKNGESLLEDILIMEACLVEIQETQEAILSTPDIDEVLNGKLQDMLAVINERATRVRLDLRKMEKEIETLDRRQLSQTDFRICDTQLVCITNKVVTFLSRLNENETTYRSRCKSRIQRQLEIAGKIYSDEDLEEIIERGTFARVFNDDIDALSTKRMRDALAEIETRHNQLLWVEESLRELHELFLDLHLLVSTQSEIIDRIEAHVEQAVNHLIRTKTELRRARVAATQYRKKKAIFYIGIFCAILVIILIIVLSLI